MSIILRKEVLQNTLEVRVTDSALERKVDNIRQINANTFAFRPTGFATGRKKVEVIVDGKAAGRSSLEIKPKLDVLHQLLHDALNPIELLCQTLNLEARSRECLDLELLDIFTNGASNPLSEYASENFDYTTDFQKQTELPTLLHFGAKYGLEHLCSTLLTFPGGNISLKIKNKDGRTPYKLALFSGFTDLAERVLLSLDGEDKDNICGEEEKEQKVEGKPTLPPRRLSFDTNGIPIEVEYENVITKNRRRIQSESCISKDSGVWLDDSYRNQSGVWTMKDGDFFEPARRRMTARMTKLWADDEVKVTRIN